MYSVYIHIFPNGKRYVGVTSLIPKLRWGANGCNYKNPYMKNAIKKYRWNNIKHEIVAEGLSFEEAEKMEIDLIKKYNSADKKYGYNISEGGIACKKCSEATKEKLRNANLGKIMSAESKAKISKFQKGQKRSKEARKNMSIAQKISFANGNNAMHSKEARKKASEKLKGRRPSEYSIQRASEAKFHAVKNLETGTVYKSIKEASEKEHIDRTTIIRHCKGTVKRKKWEYAQEN